MGADGATAPRIRVVWGTGTAPTPVASYDVALADANVHEYNLAHLSSVVPPGATIESVGTAPDLGPVGGRLWVVEARVTTDGPAPAAAALGWAIGPGGGVLYEAAGPGDEATIREEVTAGLATARAVRDRELPEEAVRSVSVDGPREGYATAVVLAAYGEAEPVI